MRYYLDFEFDDETLEPLSMGIISQDGRELYLVRPDWLGVVVNSKNHDWLKQHVVPELERVQQHDAQRLIYTKHWSTLIMQFVGEANNPPDFWGYFSDYDWVIFCKLFGRMINLPKNLPMFCLDLKQLALSVGITESLKKLVPIKDEHSAIADARWVRTVHNMIIVQYGRGV